MTSTRLARATAPSTPNRPARLNRSLLTLTGLILLAGGAYTALRGLGLLDRDTIGALGLPGQQPQTPLLPSQLVAPAWLPAATIAVGVVLGVLLLGWLLAQTRARSPRATTWRFADAEDGGATVMGSGAAAASVSAEIETYTGVDSVRAVLTGDRADAQLHLTVAVTDHAPVTEIRDRIDREALPRLRQALELESLPTEILLRLSTRAPSRTQ